MPPIVRRFVKTSFGFLIFGMLTGLHVSAAEYLNLGVVRHGYIVAHTHMILIGFVLMLIMGVALWMFPKPAEGDVGRRMQRMEIAYWLMVVGVVARAGAEILREYFAWSWLGAAVFGASSLELFSVIVFVLTLLPRIRSPREDAARAAGERAGRS